MENEYTPVTNIDPSLELQRRERFWRDTLQDADAAAKLLQESQISGAHDMLGYFEKLAIFDGSAAALLITFVGSAKRALEPAWAIKVGLVFLLMGVIGAMLRNWIYFHYVSAARHSDWLNATSKEQSARLSYYEIASRPVSLQTGKALNKEEFKTEMTDSNEAIGQKVNRLRKVKRRSWTLNVWSGYVSQAVTVAALALLGFATVRSL